MWNLNVTIDVLRRAGRSILPFSVFRRLSECYNFVAGARLLGVSRYRELRSLCLDSSSRDLTRTVEFQLPTLVEPIAVRPGTSDAGSVIHTALRSGYGKFLPDGPVRCIVDAGANIGDTTSWYLTRFPEARVVALEPDAGNYEMLRRNCRGYGDRVTMLQCGLWSRTAYLKVMGDRKMESGLFVEETSRKEDADCCGISLSRILSDLGQEQIDIFKCDIEGSETRVFGDSSDEWLARTRSIFIEIHGAEAYRTVVAATRRHSFSHRIYRDIHVFKR